MADSPCSVPSFLRALIPLESERAQKACRRHDERYALGGDRRARLISDLAFCLDLMGCSPTLLKVVIDSMALGPVTGAMEPDMAEQYLWGVRLYGGLAWPGGDAPGALPPTPPVSVEAP